MARAQADFSFVPDDDDPAFSPEAGSVEPVDPVDPLEPASAASFASERFPPEDSSLLEEPPSDELELLRRESVA